MAIPRQRARSLSPESREVITDWIEDPVPFVRDILFSPHGYKLESYQKQGLRALAAGEDVSFKACHGVGKTTFDAAALIWFMLVKPRPRVIATAPKMKQLKTRLWPEIKKFWQDTFLEDHFQWYKTKYVARDYPDTSFATAEASSDADNISGIHEGHVLIIIDEAQGVDEDIMEALEGSRTNENAQLIMTGNPVHRSGFFYDSFHTMRDLYETLSVSWDESSLVDKSFRDRIARKYGEQSSVFKVRVLGEFPDDSDEYFISLSAVEKAIERELNRDKSEPLDLGVDVGGRKSTGDESVIIPRQGPKVLDLIAKRGLDTNEIAGLVTRKATKLKKEYNADKVRIKIDDTGLGQGVTDTVNDNFAGNNAVEVYGIKAGSKPSKKGKDDFKYKGGEMWDIVRTHLRNNYLDLPDDDKLSAQLSTRPYKILDSGKIKLAPKKDLTEEEGRESPDRADALALAFYGRELYSGSATVSADVV